MLLPRFYKLSKIIKTYVLGELKKHLSETFLLSTQNIYLIGEITDNNHFFYFLFFFWGGGGGGVYIFLCLPPYNSNFRYFEKKSLVPRTLN